MMKRSPHPAQPVLVLSPDDDLEVVIEARVTARAETDALRWRFRLIIVESVVMTALVLVVGLAFHQPAGMVTRAALVIGASCFLTGLMLIGLTGAASRLMLSWRKPR